MKRPAVLLGDETSIALAALLQQTHEGDGVALLEVSSIEETRLVIDALELDGVTLIEREPGDHHRERLDATLAHVLDTLGATNVILTGNARAIQSARRSLQRRSPRPTQQVKAYWAPGKRGLD